MRQLRLSWSPEKMNGEPGADAAKTVDLRSPLVREPQPLSPKARRFEARDPANGGQARTRPVINDPPKQSHLGSAALKALRYRTMTPTVSMEGQCGHKRSWFRRTRRRRPTVLPQLSSLRSPGLVIPACPTYWEDAILCEYDACGQMQFLLESSPSLELPNTIMTNSDEHSHVVQPKIWPR